MAQKKSFKEDINPAIRFISPPAVDTSANKEQRSAPEGYKLNPLYLETKSRRLQLLLQPSLHEKIKAKAQREEKSVNEFVHLILENAMKEE